MPSRCHCDRSWAHSVSSSHKPPRLLASQRLCAGATRHFATPQAAPEIFFGVVIVSVMAGIGEVGTTSGRPTAPSSAAAAPTVPFERPCALLLARGVNLACGVRDDGLSPSCTAQLVFASFMAGFTRLVLRQMYITGIHVLSS